MSSENKEYKEDKEKSSKENPANSSGGPVSTSVVDDVIMGGEKQLADLSGKFSSYTQEFREVLIDVVAKDALNLFVRTMEIRASAAKQPFDSDFARSVAADKLRNRKGDVDTLVSVFQNFSDADLRDCINCATKATLEPAPALERDRRVHVKREPIDADGDPEVQDVSSELRQASKKMDSFDKQREQVIKELGAVSKETNVAEWLQRFAKHVVTLKDRKLVEPKWAKKLFLAAIEHGQGTASAYLYPYLRRYLKLDKVDDDSVSFEDFIREFKEAWLKTKATTVKDLFRIEQAPGETFHSLQVRISDKYEHLSAYEREAYKPKELHTIIFMRHALRPAVSARFEVEWAKWEREKRLPTTLTELDARLTEVDPNFHLDTPSGAVSVNYVGQAANNNPYYHGPQQDQSRFQGQRPWGGQASAQSQQGNQGQHPRDRAPKPEGQKDRKPRDPPAWLTGPFNTALFEKAGTSDDQKLTRWRHIATGRMCWGSNDGLKLAPRYADDGSALHIRGCGGYHKSVEERQRCDEVMRARAQSAQQKGGGAAAQQPKN